MKFPKTIDWCFIGGILCGVICVAQGYVVATGQFATNRWIADFIFLCTFSIAGLMLMLASAVLDRIGMLKKELGGD